MYVRLGLTEPDHPLRLAQRYHNCEQALHMTIRHSDYWMYQVIPFHNSKTRLPSLPQKWADGLVGLVRSYLATV